MYKENEEKIKIRGELERDVITLVSVNGNTYYKTLLRVEKVIKEEDEEEERTKIGDSINLILWKNTFEKNDNHGDIEIFSNLKKGEKVTIGGYYFVNNKEKWEKKLMTVTRIIEAPENINYNEDDFFV